METDICVNIDHILPLRLFWDKRLDENNLQVLCSKCNKKKGNEILSKYEIKQIKENREYNDEIAYNYHRYKHQLDSLCQNVIFKDEFFDRYIRNHLDRKYPSRNYIEDWIYDEVMDFVRTHEIPRWYNDRTRRKLPLYVEHKILADEIYSSLSY